MEGKGRYSMDHSSLLCTTITTAIATNVIMPRQEEEQLRSLANDQRQIARCGNQRGVTSSCLTLDDAAHALLRLPAASASGWQHFSPTRAYEASVVHRDPARSALHGYCNPWSRDCLLGGFDTDAV